jgi:pilus assembly protein TadC
MDLGAEIRVVVTSRLTVALALLLAAAILLLMARRRRERDSSAAISTFFSRDRPSSLVGGPGPLRERSRGGRSHPARRPRARAPTSEDVAASMVLLAVALQSGCGVVEGIEQVAQVAPPLPAAELAVVAAALRWGLDEQWAWAEVDPRWSRAAMAMRLAREAGVAPSSLLLSGADDLRSNRLAAIDVAAARLGVRLVVPLGVAFLPAFVLTTIVPVVLALARQVLAS